MRVDVFELKYIRTLTDIPESITDIKLVLYEDGDRLSYDDALYVSDHGDARWHDTENAPEDIKLIDKRFSIEDKDGKKYIVIDTELDRL